MRRVNLLLEDRRFASYMVQTLRDRLSHSSWQRANPSTLACTSCDRSVSRCDSFSSRLVRRFRVLCDMNIPVRDTVVVRSDIEYWWRERRFLWRNISLRGVSGCITLCWIGADTSERIMLARKNELRDRLITFPIFVPSQRLIARNVCELFSYNCGISHFTQLVASMSWVEGPFWLDLPS